MLLRIYDIVVTPVNISCVNRLSVFCTMSNNDSSSLPPVPGSVEPLAPAIEPALCRVGVKVPPFWPDKPGLWFAQLDGQFTLSNITADATKFYHVISVLDYKYAVEVEDIIIEPPAKDKYETLKRELINRLSASKHQCRTQLLNNEELGDRKPSQFLRHLRSLVGNDVADDFLRSMWISRLPGYVQAIITTQDSSKLDDVAQLADKIMEIPSHVRSSQVAAVSPSALDLISAGPSSTALREVNSKIDELTRRLDVMAMSKNCPNCRSRPRSRSQRRFRSRSRSAAKDPQVCWYHNRFGDKSAKCLPPCSYSKNY